MKDLENSPKNKDGAQAFCPPECELAFRASLLVQMEAHTRSQSGEVCGFLYEDRYVPLKNVDRNTDRYSADPADIARALRRFGEPVAVFHTHPEGNLAPSWRDQQFWYYTNSTMIIGSIVDGHFQWKVYGDRRD